jgi:hypothetical protein
MSNQDKYEIQIGITTDLDTGRKKPEQTIIITGEQLMVIEIFAHSRKNEDLSTTYILNDVEFKIMPHFASGFKVTTNFKPYNGEFSKMKNPQQDLVVRLTDNSPSAE